MSGSAKDSKDRSWPPAIVGRCGATFLTWKKVKKGYNFGSGGKMPRAASHPTRENFVIIAVIRSLASNSILSGIGPWRIPSHNLRNINSASETGRRMPVPGYITTCLIRCCCGVLPLRPFTDCQLGSCRNISARITRWFDIHLYLAYPVFLPRSTSYSVHSIRTQCTLFSLTETRVLLTDD